MQKYHKLILYYFTGTGNALKAARWICKEAEKKNIASRMYAIDDHYKANPDELDSKTLIGFLSPTHGFNIAPAMLKFILRFPSNIKSDVFILNTRGGLKFFQFFIPGISGAAQYLPMIILRLKGYTVKGGLPLDMPSNWLFFHSGLKPRKVASIVDRCERITGEFALNMLNNKKVFRKAMVTLPLDIALLPITILYYIYARFLFAKTMIYTSQCDNCKICVNNCPVQAIKIIYDRPYWTYSCEGCMRCVNICPHSAIQTSHLIFVLILFVSNLSFNYFFFKYIHLPQYINYDFIVSILEMAVTLFELFILYAVVQRLLRIKHISNLFKYTSFSTYWRRYRAPGISLKDFKKN